MRDKEKEMTAIDEPPTNSNAKISKTSIDCPITSTYQHKKTKTDIPQHTTHILQRSTTQKWQI